MQSEVSQKEKKRYVLMHICGISKSGKMILFAKQK